MGSDLSAPEKQRRRRAVCLKPGAIELVQQAIYQKWLESGSEGKLTRETRGEILGLSVATTERMLSGKGVDRPTLTLAFGRLGLAWDDAYLVGEEEVSFVVKPEPSSPPTVNWLLLVVAAIVVTCASIGLARWKWFRDLAAESDKVTGSMNQPIAVGTKLFEEGKYDEAEAAINQAVAQARKQNDAGRLASALRIDADIALAKGLMHRAESGYAEALHIRRALRDDKALPALQEALGDLCTKMNKLARAREYLLSSLKGFEKLKDETGVAMACRDLGTVSHREKDLQLAVYWFDRAEKSIAGLGKADLETDITARRALAYFDLGKRSEARKILNQCLQYWERREHPRWIEQTKKQIELIGS